MVAGVFAELAREQPRRRFTIGIDDDVSGPAARLRPVVRHRVARHGPGGLLRAGFDGTVGANKNTIKILGVGRGPARARPTSSTTRRNLGSQTESHLALRAAIPIRAPYLVDQSQLRWLPSVRFLDKVDVLGRARAGSGAAAELSPSGRTRSGTRCPGRCRRQILAKRITLFTRSTPTGSRARPGLAGRINIVLQTCFFAISDVLPREQAITRIKESVEKTYGNRGAEVLARTGRGGRRPGRAAPDRGAHPGHLHARTGNRRCRSRRRSSSAP